MDAENSRAMHAIVAQDGGGLTLSHGPAADCTMKCREELQASHSLSVLGEDGDPNLVDARTAIASATQELLRLLDT